MRIVFRLTTFDWKVRLSNYPKTPEKEQYSQFGQDVFVLRDFFKGKKNGVFVDVGANHPTHASNTYLLEKEGWTGIAIEPQDGLRSLWKDTRSVKCLGFVVGPENTQVSFMEGGSNEHGLSGVKGYNKCSTGGVERKIEQKRLDSILKDNNLSHVDYLSVDVEGYEMHVLESIDFTRCDITLVGIENDGAWKIPLIGKRLGSEVGSNSIRHFMKKNGYRYIARIMCDDFFVRN
jgi:FkbM family methyltransferase